jgi:hypothetical protein
VTRGLHAAPELKVEELLERVGAAGLTEPAAELPEDLPEELFGVDVTLVAPLRAPALHINYKIRVNISFFLAKDPKEIGFFLLKACHARGLKVAIYTAGKPLSLKFVSTRKEPRFKRGRGTAAQTG